MPENLRQSEKKITDRATVYDVDYTLAAQAEFSRGTADSEGWEMGIRKPIDKSN